MVVTKKRAAAWLILALFSSRLFATNANSGDSAVLDCADISHEVGESKKELVRTFVCESLEIRPCALRVTAVTQCGAKVGFIVAWSNPGEHPVQSWLVEWSGNSLLLNPSE